MPSYFGTPSAPTVTEGFFLQAESRVLLGTAELYNSLEVSSWTYGAYTASIGLQAGAALDLGALDSFGFSHVPSYEAVESANLLNSNIWVLTGEETTLSLGIREFKPQLVNLALGTGIHYAFDSEQEALITFGGRCDMQNRPISVEFANVSCSPPSTEDITAGITGGVLTLYDTFCSSGLPWDDISAGSINVLSLEFQVRPVLAHALGNRLGNMYLF